MYTKNKEVFINLLFFRVFYQHSLNKEKNYLQFQVAKILSTHYTKIDIWYYIEHSYLKSSFSGSCSSILNLCKCFATYSTINHNCGLQETMAGLGTTLDASVTMFHLLAQFEKENIPTIYEETYTQSGVTNRSSFECEIPSYTIGKYI